MKKEIQAIISLFLGVIGMTVGIIIFGILELFHCLLMISSPPFWGKCLFYGLCPLVGTIGIIFGIKGINSSKRGFAILGLMMSLISIFLPLYYFIDWTFFAP